MSKGLSARVRIKVCIKLRNDAKFKTIPKDVKKDCSLDKNVYGLLREFEKKGVIEVKRIGKKYSDIRLTKKGLQQLSEQMLAPYSSEIRSIVLKIDDGSAPKLEIDDNLIKFVLSIKLELLTFFREFLDREYSTVIPNNFPDLFSPELDRFFDNKIVNLDNIRQN